MDIVYDYEWEVLKNLPTLWKNYGASIPHEERDLGVWKIDNLRVLPKFFLKNNYDELVITTIGKEILSRKVIESHSGEKLKKFKTSISPRKEQLPIFNKIQEEVKTKEEVNGLIIAVPGFGKEQPYSEPVLTPNGYTTMGSLKVGDKTVGKNGLPAIITHIHEQGIKDVYKISFGDGSSTRCGLDHLWTVKKRSKQRNNGWETIDTKTIIDTYKSGCYKTKYDTMQQEYRYKINLCDPIKYDMKNTKPLKISAYAMGLILADGSLSQLNVSGSSVFSYADKNKTTIFKLLGELKKIDPNVSYLNYKQGANYTIKSKIIRDILIEYKLAGKLSINKHIPDEYLIDDSRRNLIDAFLETDSYSYTKYSKEIYSSSKVMINQLHQICKSLGIYTNKIRVKEKPKHTYKGETRIGQPDYSFVLNINPNKNTKTIINVEKVGKEKSRCITVDADDHLYITKDFTVTHNSIVAIKTVELLNTKSLIIVPNDILEGQFVDSIIEFTNLTKDDIGIIQGSDIASLIKNKVYEKDICVVKVQSLYAQLKSQNINSLYELYSVFGLVIYDEAHVGNASDGYSKTGIIFKTNNIISMTATPYRKGINNFIFQNNTGDILYESTHHNLVPDVMLQQCHIEFTEQEIGRLRRMSNDYIMFLATYNSILETKDAYFNWIADWIVYRASQGYETATLFSNNKMVYKLSKILKYRGLDHGVLTGSTSKKLEKPVLYITRSQLSIYHNEYYNIFPKRKSCPEPPVFKDDPNKFKVNKKIEKDLLKMCKQFPSLEPQLTEVENLTEREIMKLKPHVISNFKLLSAGYDKSSLSLIIFGSPLIGKIAVIQSIGRISRIDKTKRQDIIAQFLFTQIYTQFFPDMVHVLVNNIKVQYDSKFIYEGFDFDKKTNKGIE